MVNKINDLTSNPFVWRQAIQYLSKINNESSQNALRILLSKTTDSYERSEIVLAMSETNNIDEIPLMKRLYEEEKNKSYEFYFLYAIAKLGGKNEKEAIMQMHKLNDENKLDEDEEKMFSDLCREIIIQEFGSISSSISASLGELAESTDSQEIRKALNTIRSEMDEKVVILSSQYDTIKTESDKMAMTVEEMKELFNTDQWNYIADRKIMLSKVENTNQRFDDMYKTLRLWLIILGIFFTTISAISLIFVSLLLSGVLPK